MVTFICPTCGQKDVIGMLISVGDDPDDRKCSNCGEKMVKEDTQD